MIYTAVVWLILIVFLVVILVLYETSIKKKLNANHDRARDIPKFSMDLQFHVDPITLNTDISKGGNTAGGNNGYDCNATSLHTCDINDSRTLFGCKELMVTCTHFANDTQYIDRKNDKPVIIPKNKTATEGYALAIRVLASACNPYHGDLVLVSLNDDSDEYMMICSCKNPGYIGNDTLLGNCTTTYICNGHVVDIDKPLDKLECVCAQTDKSVRYDDGVPVCKPMTVQEANEKYPVDWSHIVPWNSTRLTQTSNFTKTISGNLRTKLLLDPCLSSAHDTSIAIPNAQRNTLTNECNYLDYGYPIVTRLLDDTMWTKMLPPPGKRPDGGTYPPYKRTFIDGAIITGKYDLIRFSDRIDGIDRLYGLRVENMPDDSLISLEQKGRVVLQPPNGISLGQQQVINISAIPITFRAPKCNTYWPTYTCQFMYHYGYDYNSLPVARNDPVPGGYLWNYQTWIDAESMVETALDKDRHADGVALKSSSFEAMPNIRPYGFQWCTSNGYDFDVANNRNIHTCSGVIVFKNAQDFKLHQQVKT